MRMCRREPAVVCESSTSPGSSLQSQNALPAPETTTFAFSTPDLIPEQIIMGPESSQPGVVSSLESHTVGLIVYLYSRGGDATGSGSCYEDHGISEDPAVLSHPWTIHTLEYGLLEDAAADDGTGESARRVYKMYGTR